MRIHGGVSMNNLQLHIGQEQLSESTYRVKRSSESYVFFQSEFKDINYDYNGNILLNYKEEKKNIVKEILNTVKERLSRKDKSLGISVGTPEYLFFSSEFPHSLMEDSNHNLLVPEEIHSYMKVK